MFEAVPEFDEWTDLVGWLLAADHSPYVFRGQTDAAWGLSTRLQRALDGEISDPIYRESLAIGQFKSRARLVLQDAPDEDDAIGWLCLMQHYGAPTRLLDWTESPFVAIWFAYEQGESDAALWMLNATTCRYQIEGIRELRDQLAVERTEHFDATTGATYSFFPNASYDHRAHENALVRTVIRGGSEWPLPIRPIAPDQRMAAQQSVLTVDGSLAGISESLSIEYPPIPGTEQSEATVIPLVHKIVLPNAWRRNVLTDLRTMGINAITLFPGLDGAGRDVAIAMDADLPLGVSDQLDGYLQPTDRRSTQQTPEPDPPPAGGAALSAE